MLDAAQKAVAAAIPANPYADAIRGQAGYENLMATRYGDPDYLTGGTKDGMPTFGTGVDRKYLCILFGQGAIGYGRGNPRTPSEVQRYPERANGGGVEVLWSRKTWLIHPSGFNFLSTTITGPGLSPTWADLQLATNWERVLDRKKIPMAFYVVNA